MQRKILLIVVFIACASVAFSKHLKGGWIFYEYLGKGAAANTSMYRVTINQYLDCHSEGAQIDPEVYVGIFDGGSNRYIETVPILHTDSIREQHTDFDPCITDPPDEICYRIDRYVEIITLDDNAAGYILSVQRCCRIEDIVNLINSEDAGITYTVSIPGVIDGLDARNNNSPFFKQNDLSLICINSPFSLDFSATNTKDNDSLVYSFCSGLTGGDNTPQGTQPNPPSNPPYSSLFYASSFSGSSPLGSQVTINSGTGIISGIAPSESGDYVVAVCITEYRQGIAIAQTRKEIHVSVANCQLAGAELKPSYSTCDGYTFTFKNEISSSNINSYLWSFGFNDSASTEASPTVTFPVAGQYPITLSVKNAQGCKDDATSVLNVFPGFTADFSVTGSCLQSPYVFTDASTTVYGEVDSWTWDFGDPVTDADTSHTMNPLSYKYSQTGNVMAQLIVTNTKGCVDTLVKEVAINDKPIITMPFRDTLICSIDELQLSASTDVVASFAWTPGGNIRNANTPNPLVSPKTTTTYYVNVDDGNGCVNNDSIKVNVIDQVTLSLGSDTAICLTDTIQFHPVTNGLYFAWSPAETLNDNKIKEPLAVPLDATLYKLNASVGACFADDDILVKTAPYPSAEAGIASPVCYGATTQLNASYTGNSFTWSPVNSLLHANTVTPIAGPQETTTYIFTATDSTEDGCPKPVTDTVTVVVIPPVQVFAGNDTNVVAGQALQLEAAGASTYNWSPATGMNNSHIANPLITLPSNIESVTYGVKGTTPEGCSGTDSITVYQYRTLPEIFVPAAFTPDNDGLNDILKPIVAGMKRFEHFSVYNRWGKLLYTTSMLNQGWDGNYKGTRQPPGTYVYVAQAIDYLDKPVIRKGTIVLIR